MLEGSQDHKIPPSFIKIGGLCIMSKKICRWWADNQGL